MRLEIFFLPSGRPFFDLIFAGLPRWVSPGEEVYAEQFGTCAGGSFNVAAACHRLGLYVGLCSHLGNDFCSLAIRQAIANAQMSTDFLIEHDRPLHAVTVSLSRLEDRSFVSFVDPIPPFREADLPEHGVPHIVFIPGIPENPEDLLPYLDKMKKAGSMLVCDSQHVERTIQDEAVHGLLSRLDLFLCNDKEATALTGRSDPERAAFALYRLCPEVVVKLGKRGALAIEGGMVLREKPIPVNVLDTTGAGDGFDAGYLYGMLEGMVVERRLRLGNIVAGCVASCLGGSTSSPTIEQVFELEKRHYS